MNNFDPAEIEKFSAFAKDWWDPNGRNKPLHQLNPLRLEFISQVDLKNKKILDIGCGGGILSEALANFSEDVTGIDLSAEMIKAADLHAKQNHKKITYLQTHAEAYSKTKPHTFDIVVCMELLEHVPDPQSLIQASAHLCKPGGSLFFSTINRNVKAYLFAIVGAEYICNMLPKGTHDYGKFIKPAELDSWCRQAKLQLKQLRGMQFDFFSKQFTLSKNVEINYLAYYEKPI